MTDTSPQIWIVRHCQTAWSLSGQHTGATDLPLTEQGEREALRLRERLRGISFDGVLTSPSVRAKRTCELAGFGELAHLNPDLVEWDYGKYEGLRTAEIRTIHPDWQLFRDGCPGGESPAQVADRADRVVDRLRKLPGRIIVFSSGHLLRMLAARWLEVDPMVCSIYLMLDAGSLGRLGYDADGRPVIRQWNETHYLEAAV